MFKFKNISSEEMNVIIEEEELFLAKASQRIDVIEIEGRDGAIYNELGYADIERPIKIQILDANKLDDVLAWLNGNGNFEYKNRITNARFYTAFEPQRAASIKIIESSFIRDSFWYKKDDEYEIITNEVINIGNILSRPTIRLEKGTDDNVEITINGIRFKYHFNNEEYVEIDCKEITVLYEKLNRNRQLEIGYAFPYLNDGRNSVFVNQGDSIIKIKRKDRWL